MSDEFEWQDELKKLRKVLEENKRLMRRAVAMAEDMIAIRKQFEAMERELKILKRSTGESGDTQDSDQLVQTAASLFEFEKRYMAEVRTAFRGERLLSEDSDNRARVRIVIKRICNRDNIRIPATALEVLVTQFTIALSVGRLRDVES